MGKTKQQIGKEHTTKTPTLFNKDDRFTLNGADLGFTVGDYWQFQFSNLLDKLGYVAEFLVAKALAKESPDNCNGWTLYDIDYREKKIEVKATSYYQAWKESHEICEQRTFGIRQTHVGCQKDKERQNDIYIFCLENEKPENDCSANPLNLENWQFYVIPTTIINEKCGKQKTISLNRVKKLFGIEEGLSYDQIKPYVDKIIDAL